jgi:AraC-like DNA-binding protein
MHVIALDKYSRASRFPLKVCHAAWKDENRYVHVGIPIKVVSVCFTLGLERKRYEVEWNGVPVAISKGQAYMKIAYPGDVPVTVEQSARREFYIYYAPESRGIFDLFGLQTCHFTPNKRFNAILAEALDLAKKPETPGNADLLDRLCLDLALEAQLSTKIKTGALPPQGGIFRIENYLKMHFAKPIDFDELASSYGMTLRTFYREWARNFATTPLQYLMRIRLEKAVDLLADSRLRIHEVAELCGFSSAIYFDRCFLRYYHMTPSEYRDTMVQNPVRGKKR